MARTTNLVVSSPVNRVESNMYPDSVAYGFRAGHELEGVGNLARERVALNTVPNPNRDPALLNSNDIYVTNCTFLDVDINFTEAISIGTAQHGLFKSFNGQAMRPFGYSNSRNPAAGVSAASMLVSQAEIAELYGVTSTQSLAPYNPFSLTYTHSELDTGKMAYDNTLEANPASAWASKSSKDVGGLYKGNDVLEHSLATLTAVALLSKHFINNPILRGMNNSNMDIGILAWRKSMMDNLGAFTANHVGLKSGYLGDLTDRLKGTDNTTNDGEIYAWFVSKEVGGNTRMDGTKRPVVIKDKDIDYMNSTGPSKFRNTVTQAYLASTLPEPSNTLYRFKLKFTVPGDNTSGIMLALVKSSDNSPVTYGECEQLLGFGAVGANTKDPLTC